ncbi:ferritin family protein [Thermococcus sp. JCM 11816]
MSRLIELAEKFYRDEYTDSVLYSRLAKAEKDERIKAEFQRLAQIESEHASFWYEFLKRRGV